MAPPSQTRRADRIATLPTLKKSQKLTSSLCFRSARSRECLLLSRLQIGRSEIDVDENGADDKAAGRAAERWRANDQVEGRLLTRLFAACPSGT